MRLPFVATIALVTAVTVAAPSIVARMQEDEEKKGYDAIKKKAAKPKPVEKVVAPVNVVEEPDDSIEEVEQIVDDMESEKYESPYDFKALKDENEDIVAWLNIPGSNVDYPVLYDENEKYLHMSLDGTKSYAGNIFVDADAKDILNEKLNIVYGHNMKNGTMFHDINRYSEKDFYDSHQEINVFMEDHEKRLHPVLCVVGAEDPELRFINDSASLAEFCQGKQVTQGTLPEEWNDMTVFVTCNYSGENYRTYLFCM